MKKLANLIRFLFLALFVFLLANGNVMVWLVLFGVSLLAALVFGRVYCGYVCPMNTLMLPAEWLSKKLRLQTSASPKWLKNGYFTWISLLLSLAAMLLARRLLSVNLPVLPFWLVVSVLVTLRYKPEVFHNLICPFSALQKLAGRRSHFSEKVEPDLCVGCKVCEKVCPSRAIAVNPGTGKAVIQAALCHQCANCRYSCPKLAIRYSQQNTGGVPQ